jgi:diacylglycerol kinase family enzyme
MTRHLFVVNPVTRNAPELAAEGAAVCARLGLEHSVTTTAYAGEAAEIIAREARRGGEVRAFILGGDGSLNEAVRGAAGFGNVSLGVIPCGTGNDFIKCFGGKDAFLNIEGLVNGREVPLDLVEVTLDNQPPIHAINICSVGVDADVAAGMRRYVGARRWGGSKMPYNLSLIRTVIKGVKRHYTVTVDGVREEGMFTILTCCNGQVYGGGFKACPDADPGDGQLEFLLVKGLSRFTLMKIVGRFGAGKYKELHQYIRHCRGSSVTIESDRPFYANYDGECVPASRVTFALSPYKLQFVVPEGVYFPDKARSSQMAPPSMAE